MTKLLLRWVLMAVSVIGASIITTSVGLPFRARYDSVDHFVKLMIGVLILSLLNATLGRLLKLLTLPLSCITLGLFSLVVNAIVLWVAASFELGFSISAQAGSVSGFIAAFVASLLISIISGVLGVFLSDDD